MILVTIGIGILSSSSIILAASEFSKYAESLATSNIINTQATEDGYRLSETITRAEITKIAMNLVGG